MGYRAEMLSKKKFLPLVVIPIKFFEGGEGGFIIFKSFKKIIWQEKKQILRENSWKLVLVIKLYTVSQELYQP